MKGLCAIHTVGKHVYAAGRVGGPAFLLVSHDAGETWHSSELGSFTAIVTDILMFDEQHGVLCGSSDATTAKANARILTTGDGGKTWTSRYQSARPYEITWKVSFPTRRTGYVTIQSYDPDTAVTKRVVAKSTDGGLTWSELPLADDFVVRQFGVAFLDEQVGWVGATTTGFETRDGGQSWARVELGKAVNKIRLLDGTGYAIGTEVYKLLP